MQMFPTKHYFIVFNDLINKRNNNLCKKGYTVEQYRICIVCINNLACKSSNSSTKCIRTFWAVVADSTLHLGGAVRPLRAVETSETRTNYRTKAYNITLINHKLFLGKKRFIITKKLLPMLITTII